MSPAPAPKVKLSYINAAKGVAVILVVLWHATDSKLIALEALSYLRMPLFFFTAGLFAQRGLDARWGDFLRTRVGQILWLFVLWTPIVYFLTEGVGNIVKDQLSASEATRPLLMFAEPPQTLWFLYALALMYLLGKAVRPFDWRLVIAASLMGYALVISSVWSSEVPLLHLLCRVVLLSPFFLIASYHSKIIKAFVEHRASWGLPGLLAYTALATSIMAFGLGGHPLVTFTASIVGITSLLMLLYRYRRSAIVRGLANLGSRSLFVFVLHRIPLFYYIEVLEAVGLKESLPLRFLGAFAIVAGCWVAGEYILSRYARWTMEAPWIPSKRT